MFHRAYEIITRSPGISENELRAELGLDIPLFQNEDDSDPLDAVLADCFDNGLYLYQEGDRLWAC